MVEQLDKYLDVEGQSRASVEKSCAVVLAVQQEAELAVLANGAKRAFLHEIGSSVVIVRTTPTGCNPAHVYSWREQGGDTAPQVAVAGVGDDVGSGVSVGDGDTAGVGEGVSSTADLNVGVRVDVGGRGTSPYPELAKLMEAGFLPLDSLDAVEMEYVDTAGTD
ncbi:hypothetical protein CYMTET_12836 [Cymbomonas tetramitiformis]|uniref:Uncharacterized protein n=1 Tax=Cymbomonas tetramitiformis TaxID=36881 RepID=A0AAE0LBM8_9CHLO|nr:hypothetical protein CYMTET_12836 [Cymbomonas tetramitiformis]